MKHNFRTLGITTAKEWFAARGNFISMGQWKGVTLTPDQLAALDEAAAEKGWIRSDEDKSNDVKIPLPKEDFLSDVAIAQYYLHKHQTSSERGIPFELSLSDFKKLVKRKRCYYTNQMLTRGLSDRNTFTLDRLDSNKGYTKDNTVPCCGWVNQLKNELFENPKSSLLTDVKTLGKIIEKLK